MIKQQLSNSSAGAAKPAPTHYHFVVDVSGSMHYDLPKLRKDLSNLIATTMRKDDLFSLIYYSSKGDTGYIVKGYKYSGIDSLNMAQNAIENLQSRYLTGFVDPLELLSESINEDSSVLANVMIFMSDGYENQSPKSHVLDICEVLSAQLDAAFIIEYGDYANHDLLIEMSQKLDGTFIYSQDVSAYNLSIQKIVQSEYSTKYVEVVDNGYENVFAIDNGMVRSFSSEGGIYRVPENLEIYINNGDYSNVDNQFLLGMIHISQMKGDAKAVFDFLGMLGDKYLIDLYSGAIGKQKVNEFLNEVQACLEDSALLYRNGKDTDYLPDADQYCLFNFFEDFQAGENLVFVRHEDFNYKRIGAKQVQASSVLSDEDRQVLSNAVSLEDAKALLDNKYKLNFEYINEEQGHYLNLDFNTKRANISFQIKHDVKVDLSQIPNYDWDVVEVVNTHIYRNYAIVKDMVLNVSHIVAKLDSQTMTKFLDKGIVDKVYPDGKVLLNLSKMPVVNRAMIENFDANDFIQKNYEYLKLKYEMRLLNGIKKEVDPKQIDMPQYSEEFKDWLAEIGIDHNGFNPKRVAISGSDEYYAPEVVVKFDKIGSIPTPDKVRQKYNDGKSLTAREQIMFDYIQAHSGIEQDVKRLNEVIGQRLKVKRELEFNISESLFKMFLSRYVPASDGNFSFEDYSGKIEMGSKTVKL